MTTTEKMISMVDFDSFYEAVKVTAALPEEAISKDVVHHYLKRWAEAKAWLFEKFGERLFLSQTINIAVDSGIMSEMLRGIMNEYPQYSATINEFSSEEFRKDSVSGKSGFLTWCFPRIYNKGAKPSRVLSKLIQDEKFDVSLSKIMQNRTVAGNVVISIHPMDFATMSTKSHDSTSCMDIVKGFHKTGAFSIMFDEQSAIAYHDHGVQTVFSNEFGSFSWNNKCFRQLFLVQEDGIALGHKYGVIDSDVYKMWTEMINNAIFGKEMKINEVDYRSAHQVGSFYYDTAYYQKIGSPKKQFYVGVRELECIECGKKFVEIPAYHGFLSCPECDKKRNP